MICGLFTGTTFIYVMLPYNAGLGNHFMRPAGTYGNIHSEHESSQGRFFYSSALNVSEKTTFADAGAYLGGHGAMVSPF